MWNPFKKKEIGIPNFKKIDTYKNKEKYFIRIKKWNWINNKEIVVITKNKNGQIKTLSMEYWHQEMFLDAKGSIKIKDYLYILIEQFKKSKIDVPNDLDEFMIETLENLAFDEKIIEFCDNKKELSLILENSME